MEQTLRSLLGGDSEKQVAAKLGLSQHTVHVYVKALYRKYGVSSRGELLAMWVKRQEVSH
jgi:DNA-binding CsgD family transcriptional regulator